MSWEEDAREEELADRRAEARADAAEDYHDGDGERFGFNVCVRGDCVEPCGEYGGCKR